MTLKEQATLRYKTDLRAIDLLDVMPDELLRKAVEVFGSADRAARWLTRPNGATGDAPVFLIERGEAKRVLQALGRIQHGIFA